MELLEALRIIRKQLKIVVPIVILAFVVAAFLVSRMETTYEAKGSITLLQSNFNSTNNPYLDFDQSLQTTAQVLSQTVSTSDAKASYDEKGLSTNYTIEVPYDPTRSILLPMLEISVNGNTPTQATETRDALLNDIQDALTQKQTEAGAPKETWIQAFPKSDTEVVPIQGAKSRTFLIVFMLGCAFAIVSAFVVDGFKRGLKNTRRGETLVLDTVKLETPSLEDSRSPIRRPRAEKTKKAAPKVNSKKEATESISSNTRSNNP